MRLIRLVGVLDKTGISRAQLYKLMQKNEFPSNVKISERAVAWVESEIEAWMKNRLEIRDENMGKANNEDAQC
jgi:prophage regulatory protein